MSFDFNISRSGMLAAQRMLQVTNNNISNAGVEGYARQRVEVSASTMQGQGIQGQSGNGIRMEGIERIKDDLLIQQSRNEKGLVNEYQSMREVLSSIENVFGEHTDGAMEEVLNDFFSGWEEISKFPDEDSYRISMLGQTERLVHKLNKVSYDLSAEKTNIDRNVQSELETVNEYVGRLADINDTIARSANKSPNALLDERDRVLDRLSEIVDVSVESSGEEENKIDVLIGGVKVVDGIKSKEIRLHHDKSTDEKSLGAGGSEIELQSGSMKGKLAARDEYIGSYQEKVNEFTATLIEKVNAAHQTGFDLDGNAGEVFFTGSSASTIGVNEEMLKDPRKIAASAVQGTVGNSDVAKAISSIQEDRILNDGTQTPTQFYNAFVIEMGVDLHSVKENEGIHNAILRGVEEERQSVQGVNFDEELANLMEFQHAFNINAKALQTLDQTLEDLFRLF